MSFIPTTDRQFHTPQELCGRAARAHARLYRLVGCDEPDLAANVTFTVGQILLLRLAAARPWAVDDVVAAATLAAIERAECVVDTTDAEAVFAMFAEEVLVRLDRRTTDRKGRRNDMTRRSGDLPVRVDRGPLIRSVASRD